MCITCSAASKRKNRNSPAHRAQMVGPSCLPPPVRGRGTRARTRQRALFPTAHAAHGPARTYSTLSRMPYGNTMRRDTKNTTANPTNHMSARGIPAICAHAAPCRAVSNPTKESVRGSAHRSPRARTAAHLGMAVVEGLGNLHERIRNVVDGHHRQADPVVPGPVPRASCQDTAAL